MIDMAGKIYGDLEVLSFAGLDKASRALWLCRCDCGNETVVRGTSLSTGNTRSCGCYMREVVSANATNKWGRRSTND